MDLDTDEYTALQKYISTYRDPKAAAAEENANKEDNVKPKKAWQVRDIAVGLLRRVPRLTLFTVLEEVGRWRRLWRHERS